MRLVVSDTSPINYLILIGAIDILPHLFDGIVIPTAVLRELQNAQSAAPVQKWANGLPEWVSVMNPGTVIPMGLDAGETAAICVALEHRIPLLLIDERKGRRAAVRRGLNVTGLLGLLAIAARRRLLNFERAIAALLSTSFRADPTMIVELLDEFRSDSGSAE